MKFATSAATALFLLVVANASQGSVIYLDLASTAIVGNEAHDGAGAAHHKQALADAEVTRPAAGAPLSTDAQLRLRQSTVPEQSAYSMLLIGLGLLGLHMRHQPQEEKFSVDAPQ